MKLILATAALAILLLALLYLKATTNPTDGTTATWPTPPSPTTQPPTETHGKEGRRPPPVKTFATYDEIWQYIEDHIYGPILIPLDIRPTTDGLVKGVTYSPTNVQVQGIDELDIVKTDGVHIVVAAAGGIHLVKNFTHVATIPTHGLGVFLWKDKLAVFRYGHRAAPSKWVYIPGDTVVDIYDISNPAAPRLEATITYSGRLAGARLVDGAVYLVTTMWAMPGVAPTVNQTPIDPRKVYILDKCPRTFAIVAKIDLANKTHDEISLLMSPVGWIYMSHSRLYLVTTRAAREEAIAKTLLALADSMPNGTEVIRLVEEGRYGKAIELVKPHAAAHPTPRETYIDHTDIHTFDGLEYVGTATVPGRVLDQFSIEEHQGYLLVATTVTRHTAEGTLPYLRLVATENSTNGLYVISPQLEVVGTLTGLAAGERIYAARLINNIFYLVTFRQVDPLYAIDISNITQPKVLGYVKTPGYSEYLHPLTEDTLLAIGIEDATLKISLFDTTDPTNLREKAALKLQKTYSPALYDHHAVTIHPTGLLLIPIDTKGVAAIDLTNCTLKAILNHTHALRTIYIDDKIYTISPQSIKMYTDTLQEVATLNFKTKP